MTYALAAIAEAFEQPKYEEWTVPQLREAAAGRGISLFRRNKYKTDIIAALRGGGPSLDRAVQVAVAVHHGETYTKADGGIR
tara:strand:+ start:4470 stop:4715 length:246 start_codon:yes stop_codon:yes gene_type:complete